MQSNQTAEVVRAFSKMLGYPEPEIKNQKDAHRKVKELREDLKDEVSFTDPYQLDV